MNIEIKMLNVKDGDAIIIHLTKSLQEHLVILVDGGHAGDARRVIQELDVYLNKVGKKGPDLIVCTHYDADHIGGLQTIAKRYNKDIGQVWIHHPQIYIEASNLASKIKQDMGENVLSRDSFVFLEKINEESSQETQIIIENYDQMKNLVDFLKESGISCHEPFAGDQLKDWPISVLGPTKEFYNTRLDKLTSEKVLLEEIEALTLERAAIYESENKKEILEDPCTTLDKDNNKKSITAVNEVSVIFEININGNKYLFTGDAGLISFEAIPNYPEAIKGIYWLKVQHHGSRNNSTSELFDIMKPKNAYISGKRYLDDEVRGCLENKGVKVRTTKDEGDITFP